MKQFDSFRKQLAESERQVDPSRLPRAEEMIGFLLQAAVDAAASDTDVFSGEARYSLCSVAHVLANLVGQLESSMVPILFLKAS